MASADVRSPCGEFAKRQGIRSRCRGSSPRQKYISSAKIEVPFFSTNFGKAQLALSYSRKCLSLGSAMFSVHPGATHIILKVILWFLVLYAGYCLLLFLAQRHMLFPRNMMPPLSGEERQKIPSLETIWIQTSFGKIEAWYIPPARRSDNQPVPLVIFAHGNAEYIDFCVQEMSQFSHWGMGTLLVEFPGYGRSEGKPSQASITEAFINAYDFMAQRKDIDASKIILYGRSIGGGAICSLSKHRSAAALILMSTFTSVRSFSSRYLVPAFLVRDPFDNLAAVGTFQGPVLILHGKHDEIIPIAHGKSLYQASPNAQFRSYACGHNDCPPDWRKFWGEIEKFLKDAGLIKG